MSSNEDASRPITLYVKNFIFDNISMDHLHQERVTVVDVEMNVSDARELAMYLQERLHSELPGSIRIRIRGSLTLG